MGTKDIIGMDIGLFDISEEEIEEGEKSSLDKKGKFVPVLKKINPATG